MSADKKQVVNDVNRYLQKDARRSVFSAHRLPVYSLILTSARLHNLHHNHASALSITGSFIIHQLCFWIPLIWISIAIKYFSHTSGNHVTKSKPMSWHCIMHCYYIQSKFILLTIVFNRYELYLKYLNTDTERERVKDIVSSSKYNHCVQ